MAILEHTQFKNKNDDKVDVRLISYGDTFQVIINVERTRRTTEKRFKNMVIVEMKVMTFTKEVEVLDIPLKVTAVNEYNMRRAINGDPSYSMADYIEWQKTQQEEK